MLWAHHAGVLRGEHWKKVAHSGNINKYAVFVELCLRAAKPGVLVALVIPSSFRTGPLYTKLRGYLQAQAYQDAADAPATRLAYAFDMKNYEAWCSRPALVAMPAASQVVGA